MPVSREAFAEEVQAVLQLRHADLCLLQSVRFLATAQLRLGSLRQDKARLPSIEVLRCGRKMSFHVSCARHIYVITSACVHTYNLGKHRMSSLYEDFQQRKGKWHNSVVLKSIRTTKRSTRRGTRRWPTKAQMLEIFQRPGDRQVDHPEEGNGWRVEGDRDSTPPRASKFGGGSGGGG